MSKENNDIKESVILEAKKISWGKWKQGSWNC